MRLTKNKSIHVKKTQSEDVVILPQSIELETHETPVLLVRQHWFVFRDPLLIALFIPFVLFFSIFFLNNSSLELLYHRVLVTFLKNFAYLCALLGLGWFVWRLYLWKKTYYIITNLRIILITRYSIFSHDDRETALSMIQDVQAVVNGIVPTLYGFGDVIVQVSSEDSQLVLRKIPKPRAVQRVIMQQAHLH